MNASIGPWTVIFRDGGGDHPDAARRLLADGARADDSSRVRRGLEALPASIFIATPIAPIALRSGGWLLKRAAGAGGGFVWPQDCGPA
ncbi:MAG: hypothetical protein H6872_01210 [Methylobacteriaceae bacterium]|nr:hypothetical protein [Methylobacteriaceae bacterium]